MPEINDYKHAAVCVLYSSPKAPDVWNDGCICNCCKPISNKVISSLKRVVFFSFKCHNKL